MSERQSELEIVDEIAKYASWRVRPACQGPPTWTTKDKRVIPIKDLEDSHLVNIVKMLARNAERIVMRYHLQMIFSVNRCLRGEMARESAFSEIEQRVAGHPVCALFRIYETFRALVLEAHSRTLPPPLDAEIEHVFEAVGLV